MTRQALKPLRKQSTSGRSVRSVGRVQYTDDMPMHLALVDLGEPASGRPTTAAQFEPGEMVTILQLAFLRRPLIEGRAEVIAPIAGSPGAYLVRFEGESQLRERIVMSGAFQRQPEQVLEELLKMWRAAMTPAILAEFFPGDLVAANENQTSASDEERRTER